MPPMRWSQRIATAQPWRRKQLVGRHAETADHFDAPVRGIRAYRIVWRCHHHGRLRGGPGRSVDSLWRSRWLVAWTVTWMGRSANLLGIGISRVEQLVFGRIVTWRRCSPVVRRDILLYESTSRFLLAVYCSVSVCVVVGHYSLLAFLFQSPLARSCDRCRWNHRQMTVSAPHCR